MIVIAHNRTSRWLEHGFTLVEVLLALALTSIVATTVVMMMAALASGVDVRNDIRRAGVKRQTAIFRLGSLTRAAARVLSVNGNELVLWTNDVNGNGKPELSELRRIHWDSDKTTVSSYEAPPTLDATSEATYELTADFSAVTSTLAGSTAFPGQVVVQHVKQWDVTLDSTSIQSAHLMRLRLSIDNESGTDVAVIVAALRATTD